MYKLKKKIADIANKIVQIAGKRLEFLLGTMYFIGNDGDQNFLVFASVLNSLILDSNRNVINQTSTGISSEKAKPVDTDLEAII